MRILFSSLPYLRNWKTRFVYFLLIPLISLGLLVLINAQYTNHFEWFVAVATTTLSGGTLAMSGIAELFVMDRTLGIDRELVANRPYSFKYWGTRFLTATLSGIGLIVSNLLLLALFQAPLVLIFRALLVTPVIVLSGTIVGFVAAIAAWQQTNPYFYLNIVNTFATVVAGALLLIDRYPGWLRLISRLFPFSFTIRYVITGQGSIWPDLVAAVVWLAIGLILYQVQLRLILRHPGRIW